MQPFLIDPNEDEADRIGLCYVFSAQACLHPRNAHLDNLRLVHGTIHQTGAEHLAIGHGWVEWTYEGNKFIFEPTTGSTLPSDASTRMFSFRERVRYTPEEAERLVLETGNWGVWDGFTESKEAMEAFGGDE